MKIRTIGVLLLTATLTLLGCSDPAGPEVVGDYVWAALTEGPRTFCCGVWLGDGVIFPDTAEIDLPGIVLEQDGKTIEIRGAGQTSCPCTPAGVVELHGKNQLTVTITHGFDGATEIGFAFAFQATTSELESGSYDVRVIFRHFQGISGDDIVHDAGTVAIVQ